MYLTSNLLKMCHSLDMDNVSQFFFSSQFKETAIVFVGDRLTQRSCPLFRRSLMYIVCPFQMPEPSMPSSIRHTLWTVNGS